MDGIFAKQNKDDTSELRDLLLNFRPSDSFTDSRLQAQDQFQTVAPGQFPTLEMNSDLSIQAMYRLAGFQPPSSQPSSAEISPRDYYDSSNFTTPATSEANTPMPSDDEDNVPGSGRADIYSGRNLQVPSGALKRRLSFSETGTEKKAEITPTRARALSSADSTAMSVQDDDEAARQKKERNRISARLSRQRKKQQIVLLETQASLFAA